MINTNIKILPFLLLFAVQASWSSADIAQLSYFEASQQMLDKSNVLAAQRAAVQSKLDKQESVKHITGPKVLLSSSAYHYDVSLDIELDGVKDALGGVAKNGTLGKLFPNTEPKLLSGLMKKIPDSYELHQKGNKFSNLLIAYWPIYAGGKGDSIYALTGAMAAEEQATLAQKNQLSYTQLAQRYFAVGMAQRVLHLTQAVQKTVEQHDNTAQKMLEAGLIAKIQRMQAKVALTDSQRLTEQAGDQLELARLALAKFLQNKHKLLIIDGLFVNQNPLKKRQYFIDTALKNNPAFATVDAKRQQILQANQMEKSNRRPQITAFGVGDLKDKNWVVGLNLHWTLFEGLNRSAQDNSSLRLLEQVDYTDLQLRSDLSLLVEKNWLTVEHSRQQYFAFEENIKLAKELQRMRVEGLRQGVSTVQDLMDAETQLLQAQTQQVKFAYDYVIGLAQLLESCGQADKFIGYLKNSDIQVK